MTLVSQTGGFPSQFIGFQLHFLLRGQRRDRSWKNRSRATMTCLSALVSDERDKLAASTTSYITRLQKTSKGGMGAGTARYRALCWSVLEADVAVVES